MLLAGAEIHVLDVVGIGKKVLFVHGNIHLHMQQYIFIHVPHKLFHVYT